MGNQVTAAQVKAIAGAAARPELVAAIVNGWSTAVEKARLTTKNRACHFLAQIMTETGGLRLLSESGAYSYNSILKIFGAAQYSKPLGGSGHSAGIAPNEARRIAALPLAQRGPVLFNRVYGVGNPTKMKEFGNTGPNDGWLYRGSGMMQATGKINYAAMQKKTGLPLVAHPELLHVPDSAFMAAYLEWIQDGRCGAAADRDDVVTVRKVINGGKNGLTECRTYLAKAKKALADYESSPLGFVAQQQDAPADLSDDTLEDDVDEDAAPAIGPVVASGPDVKGDPELYSVQWRLKAMNFTPGLIDGDWGSGTAGAIAGFINGRDLALAAPTSLDMFNQVRSELKAEISRAEAEGWKRPVSDVRASGDIKVVAQAAPEVVPVRRNFLASAWATFIALITAIWQSISDYASTLWDFFTGHKDDIPSDPGIMHAIWDRVSAVPVTIWLFLAAVGFGILAFNARNSVKQIKNSVQTGARQ